MLSLELAAMRQKNSLSKKILESKTTRPLSVNMIKYLPKQFSLKLRLEKKLLGQIQLGIIRE
jgi:hypothetical protein